MFAASVQAQISFLALNWIKELRHWNSYTIVWICADFSMQIKTL